MPIRILRRLLGNGQLEADEVCDDGNQQMVIIALLGVTP